MSRAVIIGAGSIGLHAAYHLRAQGHEVVVVERAVAGREGSPRDGASFGHAGVVVPSHFVPLAAPGIVPQGVRWMANPESPFYVRPRPSLDLLAWGVRFALAANARHVERTAPSLLALNLRSRELWDDLVRELGDVGFCDRGLLMLCRTQEALKEEARIAEMARQLGLDADVLDAQAVRQAEPDIDLDAPERCGFPTTRTWTRAP